MTMFCKGDPNRFLLPKTQQHLLRLQQHFDKAMTDGDFAAARRLGLRLCLLFPHMVEPHVGLALSCLRHGCPEQAVVYAQRALKLSPRHTQARFVFQEALEALHVR